MKNNTQTNSGIQLSFETMGTAPYAEATQNDMSKITQEIENKWKDVKSFLKTWGKNLSFKLRFTMPKIIIDLGNVVRKTPYESLESYLAWRDNNINKAWSYYRRWKESITNGKQNINIPDFVYLLES